MKFLVVIVSSLLGLRAQAQAYTSYFTGSTDDSETPAMGGVCLMGGAGESDPAAAWFLEKSNGGDILVLRASGADGYNNYFYEDLGVSVNSVETIVFHDASAADDAYIHDRIKKAEAIWFAGGNQWTYISYWRNTPIDSLLRKGINERNVVVGGTSAGMAILGDVYFSAEYGTVTSDEALNNPFHPNITADSSRFIDAPYLDETTTDTHYDDPDRKGRHVVFISRMLMDYGMSAKGIACDEYTAVCIDTDEKANVYGAFPDYDDNAYFIQTNCDLIDDYPETYEEEVPLTWDLDQEALRVYAVKGTPDGDGYFDLSTWKTGSGGEWLFWSVSEGVLTDLIGEGPVCDLSYQNTIEQNDIQVYFNQDILKVQSESPIKKIQITDLSGSSLFQTEVLMSNLLLWQTDTGFLPEIFVVSVITETRIVNKLVVH